MRNGSDVTAQHYVSEALSATVNMLDYLGDTLPRLLLAEGFTGDREQSDSDPVARYLVARVPGAVAARCDSYMIEVVTESGYVASAYTPKLVADFMESFDRGDFPQLVTGVEQERAA